MPFTTLIDPKDLLLRLDAPDWVVVDCRFSLADTQAGRRAYRAAHIPGAVYAHLDEDLSGAIMPGRTGRHPLPDVEAFARTLGAWGIDARVQVVAYDDMGGGIAGRLWAMLHWLGHRAAAVLDGGWPAWQRAGLPKRTGQEHRPARRFIPRPDPDLHADAEAVARAVRDPAARVLDARAAERFRGETEPYDPVAGHIPGAVSAPWTDNLDAEGRFLPPEVLRARFSTLLDDTPPERVICYCGSGVTANHNRLAMAHAGLGLPRLYPGSWSEWITDPARPVAVGP